MAFFARVAAAFGVFLLAAACAAPPTPTQLRPPQSFADLLLNIRDATRSGLILEEGFFTEENLKRSFGAANARVTRVSMDSNTSLAVTMRDFPAWGAPKPSEPGRLHLGVGWYRGFRAPDGKPRAGISLANDAVSNMKFEAVEQLFGPDWTEVGRLEYIPIHMAPPPPPATHRMGYATIRYDLADPRLERTLTISFDRDGTIQSLRASANGYSQLFP
jgi:hypothetical protein